MASRSPAVRSLTALGKRTRSGHVRPASIRFAETTRNASTSSAPTEASPSGDVLNDLSASQFSNSSSTVSSSRNFDPASNAQKRDSQLPASRYQYKPPKYYRGPLHPHQPPSQSDPASREFVPGPFSAPRLEETYMSTIASDLMTLSYQHYPPGFEPPPKAPRLRAWDGSSPYHKGRPLRGPRGSDVLNLLRKRVTFRNIPKLEGVVVHTFVREAIETPAAMHVASIAVQAITGQKVRTHVARKSEIKFGLKAGKHVSLSTELKGEDMYHFLGKVIDVVLPRIRDWKGVNGTTGDSNGNLAFGLVPDVVALFPEIEVNYDQYPPKLIPGCHITIKTSATTDRDARQLAMAMGLPFTGKFIN